MSTSDLAARPMLHHTKDAIEAHLTIVFTALAISPAMRAASDMSIKRIVQTLRPLQQMAIRIGAHIHADPLPSQVRKLLTDLGLNPTI